MRFCWKYVDLQRVHLHYTHYLKEINRAISIFEHFLLRRQCLKARRYTNLKVSSPSIKGRNSRVYEKAAALLSVENAGCCKIKSYLQQHLSFFRRAIRGVPGITFSVQAKPTHAESVIFVYGKQTCSSFVVLGRLCQAVFGSNSAFPNRPSASRLHSFRILNAVARIKRRVSLLVFPRVRNLPNP